MTRHTMPTAATTVRPAPWRVAVALLAETLSFVSSLALLVLLVVVVRDEPLLPQHARIMLLWGVPAALLASFFTRRLERSRASGEPPGHGPVSG